MDCCGKLDKNICYHNRRIRNKSLKRKKSSRRDEQRCRNYQPLFKDSDDEMLSIVIQSQTEIAEDPLQTVIGQTPLVQTVNADQTFCDGVSEETEEGEDNGTVPPRNGFRGLDGGEGMSSKPK
ncbi:hypothetical protein JTE90_019515 [Oedothorax gibbosus]|uniref:Uncharacterized protein n=1 Tax=Oedothorax gibbosus TaxID=931172 RepID=A0AAV6VIP1_9ARAC|nr:hypothetical protein JTE90_019515 [Oedothorax gibbosus]